MGRILLAAGLHLDRAWPELGAVFGRTLREFSRQALARTVEVAHENSAESILFVGDLMDRATVMPDTLEFVHAVFDAFPGQVMILPGARDWVGNSDPYTIRSWSQNVHVFRSANFVPAPNHPHLLGSAWTSAHHQNDPAIEPSEGIHVRARLKDPEPWPSRVIVTSGHVSSSEVVTLSDIVQGPGERAGFALVFDDTGHEDPREISLGAQPGNVVVIDVTALRSQESFDRTLSEAFTSSDPTLVRLQGLLAPTILLPGYSGSDLPAHVTTDLSMLGYSPRPVDDSDRSALAEFVRAMDDQDLTEKQRHQTIAMGLLALEQSTN